MNTLRLVVNRAERSLATMFPGFFNAPKHNFYADFGYPDQVVFADFFKSYTRNGLARAGVNKTIAKTWQDYPFLLEKVRDGSQGGQNKETTLEGQIRQRFDDLRVWQQLSEADRRSLVGAYSGVILRIADSRPFNEPVDQAPGGLAALVEIIPAWEGQLTVSEWDTDETSPTYGEPKMFAFQESAVDKAAKQQRQFQLHPDRVVIWSADGTVNGRSFLEPGYNDLLTMEKISGAGGEGFWKNAKSAPVLEVDKEANADSMARAMGVPVGELVDKMGDQVRDWQAGFDELLMIQGMQAKTLGVTLPSPEHFFAIALQSFAASINIPTKILVGMQTGERASSEDAQEWAQTNMSRRTGQVIPNIMVLVRRLERFGILPERDWYIDWTDLTESSMGEKVDRAGKMADVNQKMKDSGEFIFTPEEIRGVVGMEPLSEAEKVREEEDDESALTPPAPEDDPAE